MGSVFFRDCFGVFQGGGARAAAFAGAYCEAHKEGIRFSEVAGTSAGSIAAVFVGAGATPEFIEDALSTLDFRALLHPPDPQQGFEVAWARWLGMISAPFGWVFNSFHDISKVLRYGGCYSSRGIEEWIEQKLCKLLPNARSPICFGDLRIPTYVVATNLATKSSKVWSTIDNKRDSVALAVRASCSIPLFFQPVLVGDARLVDGGMLSNLPAFVFDTDGHRPAKRVLAFRLQSETPPVSAWTPKEMAAQLIDTIVSGATELQVGILRSVSCIDIPTGGIRATDFDKMEPEALKMLFKGGQKATQQFLASEAMRLRVQQNKTQVFHDRDEVYLATTKQNFSLPSEVLIAERDTDWYWRIFPTVLYWRIKGIPVRVLLQVASGSALDLAKEKSRRLNLTGVGAQVEEMDKLPLQGYVFSRKERDASSAIVFLPSREHSPVAIMYEGPSNQQIVHLVQERIATVFTATTTPSFVPKLTQVRNDHLCNALKNGVTQYAPDCVTVTVESVAIKGARTITRLIREYKYEQMVRLVELLDDAGIPLFAPTAVILSDGRHSLMGPPVFEIHGKNNIGVEGNTRTYYSLMTGRDTMTAVVVRGVRSPLPGTSVEVTDCCLTERAESPSNSMPGFNYDQFRRIEGACHPHR